MNKNCTTLNNFPEEILEEILLFWNKYQETARITGVVGKWGQKYFDACQASTEIDNALPQAQIYDFETSFCELRNKLQELIIAPIDSPFGESGKAMGRPFTMMTTAPNAGHQTMHTDVHRRTILNIPIVVDTDYSIFYIGNDEDVTEIELERGAHHSVGARRFLYEPEKLKYYNLKNPVVFDCTLPHGFANWSNEERVILSIALDGKYEDIVPNINKELF